MGIYEMGSRCVVKKKKKKKVGFGCCHRGSE